MPETVIPAFDHIFVVIMENHGFEEIIGSREAPFINGLAATSGLAANYTSVAHPSLPNYLALVAGETFGITTDCTDCFQAAPNLVADRISASGRTWRGYLESMPSAGYVGDAYPYMQKHNPFIYFNNIRENPEQAANVVPYRQLAADLASVGTTPSFGWITPNMLDDMHDGTIAQGDAWLAEQIPLLTGSPAWMTRQCLLVITWDENEGTGDNRVATILAAGGAVPAGFQSGIAYNHYSLLRTIEAAWDLAPLTANDAQAAVMADFFPASPPGG